MAILTECEICGKKYRFPDHLGGTIVPCKECGAGIDVPAGAMEPAASRRAVGRGGPAPSSGRAAGRAPQAKRIPLNAATILAGVGGLLGLGMILLAFWLFGPPPKAPASPQALAQLGAECGIDQYAFRPPREYKYVGRESLDHVWRGPTAELRFRVQQDEAFRKHSRPIVLTTELEGRQSLDYRTTLLMPEAKVDEFTIGGLTFTRILYDATRSRQYARGRANGGPYQCLFVAFDEDRRIDIHGSCTDGLKSLTADVLQASASTFRKLDYGEVVAGPTGPSPIPSVASTSGGGRTATPAIPIPGRTVRPPAAAGDASQRAAVPQQGAPAGNAPVANVPIAAGLAPDGLEDPVEQMPAATEAAMWKLAADPPETPASFEQRRAVQIPFPNGSDINDIVFPHGPSTYVAVGRSSFSGTGIEVWNMKTREKVGGVVGVKFWDNLSLSPDGKYVAGTVSRGNGLIVYDVKAGRALGALPLTDNSTHLTVCGFPNSKRVVAGGFWASEIKVWELPSGELERTISLPDSLHHTVSAFSPGGKYLALGQESQLKFYNLDTGAEEGSIAYPLGRSQQALTLTGLAFSPDGEEVAAIFARSPEGRLVSWSMADGKVVGDIDLTDGLEKAGPVDGSRFEGVVLQWFPDRQRWLYKGNGIIDRQQRKVIFNIGGENGGSPRRVIDNDRIVVAVGTRNDPKMLTTYTPDEAQLARGAQVVEAGGTALDANLPPLAVVSWDACSAIPFGRVGGPWNVQPDPAPEKRLMPRPVEVKTNAGEVRSFLLSRADSARAAVMYKADSRSARLAGRASDASWLDVYDLSNASRRGTLRFSFGVDLQAISPDGTLAATSIAEHADRIDLWNLTDRAHVIGFRPWKDGRKLQGAAFVDSQHLLTLDDQNELALWELPACRPIYRIERAGRPGLSPGGKYLVISTGKSFRFLDTLTGEACGDLPVAGTIQAIAFHPDGEKLAVLHTEPMEGDREDSRRISHLVAVAGEQYFTRGGIFTTWDLRTGEMRTHAGLPVSSPIMQWTSDFYVLFVGSQDRYSRSTKCKLVDAKTGGVVWTYELAVGVQAPFSPDLRHWLISPMRRGTSTVFLATATLPDPDLLVRIGGVDTTPDYLLKPGDEVSLTISLPVPAGDSRKDYDKIRDNLVKKFAANGVRVVDNAPIKVTLAASEGGGGGSVEYKTTGTNERTTVARREVKSVLTVQNGNRKWQDEYSSSNTPFFAFSQAGENLQQTLSQSMWSSIYFHYTYYTPPMYILPEGADVGLGSSQLLPD